MKIKGFIETWIGQAGLFVLQCTGLLLLSDVFMRVVFFLYNYGEGGSFSFGDACMSFFAGIRFDLATLALFNGVLLVIMAMPLRILWQKWPTRIFLGLLLLLHLPVWVVNAIDVIYYGYSSKRLTFELFATGKEIGNYGADELLPFWWLFFLVFGMMGLLWWIMNRWGKTRTTKLTTKLDAPEITRNAENEATTKLTAKLRHWGFAVVFAGLIFLAFRGGWQHRPLRPADAFVTSSFFLGNVTLNSAYTVIQSIDIGSEQQVDLMPMPEAIALARQLVRNDFDGPFLDDEYPLMRTAHFDEPEQKYNVVLLILESFNASKVGCIKGLPLDQSLTPNFDTLARHGRLYTNFHSNGSRSVQSLPAIFNSIPEVFTRPTIGSSFETNPAYGLGNMLDARGYNTSFACAGPNGTMGFDAYCRLAGVKDYYGQNEIVVPDRNVASKWGLHDRSVLNWLADQQAKLPQPFMNVWFSISNHHPFVLPQDCPPSIAQSALAPMEKTVKYTDWALGEYFAKVRKTEWAKNTIFLLTADHCFYYDNDPDRGDVHNFHVPLLLIGPGIQDTVDQRVGSHLSILPTLMELLHLSETYSGAGVSLFSKANQPYNISNIMGFMSMVRANIYWNTTLDRTMACYVLEGNEWQIDETVKTNTAGLEMDRWLKALYQVCSYARVHNRLFTRRLE